jgi:hypothetical protein
MAKLKVIRTDPDRMEDGVWRKYIDDVELLIASVNNRGYHDAKDRLLRPHLRQVRAKALSPDEVLEIIKPAVAHHILKGWKNIQDDNGTEIPFSPQTALEFFRDPGLADLYSFVLEVSGEIENYRQQLLEEAAGN